MAEISLEKLQGIIGYRFNDPQLLREALTHSSFARESSDRGRDNEQLEFLGDAVLNFLVSARLAEAFPEDREGKLSRGRARLVGADHLSKAAAQLGLGDYLRLGRGEEKTGGRLKNTLLVNALEALVAALYRDGGLEAARRFVESFVMPAALEATAEELFSVDYKSALQEFLQAERLSPAEYRVVEEAGPEHQKTFTVEVRAGENWVARGRGSSKKAAEVQAARELLERRGRQAEIHG
ncbi:MAG: ribonuclease III [Acidobacteria bacterium]|nr:ribonuclease III [Acidobacteriota bacterium]